MVVLPPPCLGHRAVGGSGRQPRGLCSDNHELLVDLLKSRSSVCSLICRLPSAVTADDHHLAAVPGGPNFGVYKGQN